MANASTFLKGVWQYYFDTQHARRTERPSTTARQPRAGKTHSFPTQNLGVFRVLEHINQSIRGKEHPAIEPINGDVGLAAYQDIDTSYFDVRALLPDQTCG